MSIRIMPLVFLISTALSMAQDLDHVVIPRKTDIFVTLGRSLNTKTATAGDKFYATVAVPVTIQDQIVIPVGSYIIGHVDTLKEAGRIKGRGQIDLHFDTVILPSGLTRRMVAVVASAEGYGSSNEKEGAIEAESDQGAEVGRKAVTGGVTGAAIGSVAGRSWKGAGIGGAIGAAGGAVIGLLEKNREVVLPRGTSITIQLTDDVGFVKPEPPPQGTPLTPKGEDEPGPK